MMYLAFDPSVVHYGYAVFDDQHNLVFSESVKLNNKLTKEKRWFLIYQKLKHVCLEFKIDTLITEMQFDGSLLQTIAMCGMIAGELDLDIFYYAPLSWKKHGLGSAKLSKDEVKKAVSEVYDVRDKITEHECDAIGMFLCHLNKRGKDA